MSNIENFQTSSLSSKNGENIYNIEKIEKNILDSVVSYVKDNSHDEWDGTVPEEIVEACAKAGVPLLDVKDITFYDKIPKSSSSVLSNMDMDMDMVDPIIIEVPKDQRIRTYLHPSVSKIMYDTMGPNWEFHLEEEFVSRAAEELVRCDVDLIERAKVLAQLTSRHVEDFIKGVGIKNRGTQFAIYNWQPEILIRDQLAAHPSWKKHTVSRDGVSIVVRVSNPRWYSDGYDIPHHPICERLRLWKKEALKTRETYFRCKDCMAKGLVSEVPPPLQLTRQKAVHFYCFETIPCECINCGDIFVQWFSF